VQLLELGIHFPGIECSVTTTVPSDSASLNIRRISSSLYPRFAIFLVLLSTFRKPRTNGNTQLRSSLVYGFWMSLYSVIRILTLTLNSSLPVAHQNERRPIIGVSEACGRVGIGEASFRLDFAREQVYLGLA